jgi:hypothetical protein
MDSLWCWHHEIRFVGYDLIHVQARALHEQALCEKTPVEVSLHSWKILPRSNNCAGILMWAASDEGWHWHQIVQITYSKKHELKRNEVYSLMSHPPNRTAILESYDLTIYPLPNLSILQNYNDKGNINISSLATRCPPLSPFSSSFFWLFFIFYFLGGLVLNILVNSVWTWYSNEISMWFSPGNYGPSVMIVSAY